MDPEFELIRFTTGPLEENAYLIVFSGSRTGVLVDPGLESESILEVIRERAIDLRWVLNTHGHVDHVAGNRFFVEATGAKLAAPSLDLPLLRSLRRQAASFGFDLMDSPEPHALLDEGRFVVGDDMALDVIHTPGHTPGGVCLRLGGLMLVGDTLFRGSVGRTDLPGGSWPDLVASIRDKLFRLPDETVCYPGHGPETTIAEERRSNPFVSDAARAGERW